MPVTRPLARSGLHALARARAQCPGPPLPPALSGGSLLPGPGGKTGPRRGCSLRSLVVSPPPPPPPAPRAPPPPSALARTCSPKLRGALAPRVRRAAALRSGQGLLRPCLTCQPFRSARCLRATHARAPRLRLPGLRPAPSQRSSSGSPLGRARAYPAGLSGFHSARLCRPAPVCARSASHQPPRTLARARHGRAPLRWGARSLGPFSPGLRPEKKNPSRRTHAPTTPRAEATTRRISQLRCGTLHHSGGHHPEA